MRFILLLLILVVLPWMAAFGSNFSKDFDVIWGSDGVRILNNGELLTLSLDKQSGSAFQSSKEFVYGNISMQLKLVHGYSAGTVTSYYLASKGSEWDEIDFEFLGNLSGDPYTVHTNVIIGGKGDREQQFHLWFDPTEDFHTYSILWNSRFIIFYVDDIPIRQFKKLDSSKVPFPERQPMRVHCSIWNADEWATRGGLVKTDWAKAPFTASFRNFRAQAQAQAFISHPWLEKKLNPPSLELLMWVQKNYMIYNYCFDNKRFPQGLPPECAATN